MKKLGLYQGKTALLDALDYQKAIKLTWSFDGRYVSHSTWDGKQKRSKKLYLHHFLLGNHKNLTIDHINGNPLDNRRSNLRICNYRQNGFNSKKAKNKSSNFKGVSWAKLRNKWLAHITTAPYKVSYIGYFEQEHHAAMAVDLWSKELYGEYANLNFNPIN